MRSVVYRFPELDAFELAVSEAHDSALALPPGEVVEDGEWVLAIFELGPARRATSAAGQGDATPEGPGLVFEPRDVERLAAFGRETARRLIEGRDAREPSRWGSAPPKPPAEGSGSGGPEPSRLLPAPSLPRVLVVDDDPDIREVVGAMLEAVGLAVCAVSSGEEALEHLAGEPYDLVVLDWNLPGRSGLDVCKKLRRAKPTGRIPILFLTAHAASQDMVDAFASGADDYVVKPFRAPELGARIFSLIRRTRRATAS